MGNYISDGFGYWVTATGNLVYCVERSAVYNSLVFMMR